METCEGVRVGLSLWREEKTPIGAKTMMQKLVLAELLRLSNTVEGRSELSALQPGIRFQRELGDPGIERRVAELEEESRQWDADRSAHERT